LSLQLVVLVRQLGVRVTKSCLLCRYQLYNSNCIIHWL